MKTTKASRPDRVVPAGAYTVKSLVKALRILEFLAEGNNASYTLTELSRGLHLHVSTVHRLLVNLLRQGFVETDPATGGYRLGFRVLRMGLKVLDQLDFRRVADPLLRQLNRQTEETVHLAILRDNRAISIEIFGSSQPMGLTAPIGGVLPLHSSGVGKALLAFQPEDHFKVLTDAAGLDRYTTHTITSAAQLRKELAHIRQEGISIDNEEAVIGLRCVAAPIFDHHGNVIAAFSVAGPTTRVTPARVPLISKLVKETSWQISFRLGHKASSAGTAATPTPPGGQVSI
jgi:IclR family transcriptional regulator, KDG regulon repressor